MGVMRGAQHIPGLIQEEIKLTLDPDRPATDLDTIDVRVYADSLLTDKPAIDRHLPVGNQRLARAA
jgi:hypothetical protein